MNRAAERAAPQAKQIFWDAIGAMTIDDARAILGGHDTAATAYLKIRTNPAARVTELLREVFGRR
jgi:hypothetical protein